MPLWVCTRLNQGTGGGAFGCIRHRLSRNAIAENETGSSWAIDWTPPPSICTIERTTTRTTRPGLPPPQLHHTRNPVDDDDDYISLRDS